MGRLGRATLGIYNSYDRVNFREPHRRALARAGALALAYDQNLAIFGFPISSELSTPLRMAEWLASTTSIGEDGKYIMELAQANRFSFFPYPRKGFPPQLGEIILTTSKPDVSKAVEVEEIVDMLLMGRSICLLIGLGPRGIPDEIRAIPRMHLDITGTGRSLETCTALGAISAVIATGLRRALKGSYYACEKVSK